MGGGTTMKNEEEELFLKNMEVGYVQLSECIKDAMIFLENIGYSLGKKYEK